MSLPFKLPIGQILEHNGHRIRFECALGKDVFLFRDCSDLGPYRPYDDAAGMQISPSLSWIHKEYAAGRLVDPGARTQSVSDRQKKFAGLDAAACFARDPKVEFRTRWAWEALKENPPRTDTAYAEFINRRNADIALPNELPPSPPTLRRLVRKLENGDNQTNALLSLAGRVRGQSQLSPLNDSIVHQAALYYWADPNASIFDAASFMYAEWSKLTPEQLDEGNQRRPSYETLRLRVRSLETYATFAAKHGKPSADKHFSASGEPIPVTRVFERVYMDGFELEQAVVFDDDWPLPGGKMKTVACIEAYSTAVFKVSVFAGPYRSETSVQALINMMTPPVLTDEEYAANPEAAWAFGVPATIVPDNDRTLIGPGYVPGLNELGSTLELPGVYHHDGKALIENFGRFLKRSLEGLPGTIRGPRHPKHPQDNPLAATELTRESLAKIVDGLVLEWNTTPKKTLGDRSPFQVLYAGLNANPRPLLCNPGQLRRTLAKTVNGCVLTQNGVEHDGIRYRGEIEVESFLVRNGRDTPHAERIASGSKCIVSIRTYEGDLDQIDVFDPEAGSFITLRSTSPDYTGMLTRYEHSYYKERAAFRREKFKTEDQRLASKAKSLAEIDRAAPKASFARRSEMMAMYANEKVRRLSGKMGEASHYLRRIPDTFFDIQLATSLREDLPAPPPGSTGSSPKTQHLAPARPEGVLHRREPCC